VQVVTLKIFGVEQRVCELRGHRAPLVYWKRLWRTGRPPRPFLLPVLEEARRQLLPTARYAVADDLPTIRELERAGQVTVPNWVWPDQPPPPPKHRRPQVQDWRRRRADGGWPPPTEPINEPRRLPGERS
jgi:hypothetical protein